MWRLSNSRCLRIFGCLAELPELPEEGRLREVVLDILGLGWVEVEVGVGVRIGVGVEVEVEIRYRLSSYILIKDISFLKNSTNELGIFCFP